MNTIVISPEFYNYGSLVVAGILKNLKHKVNYFKGFKNKINADITFISLQSTIHLLKYQKNINSIDSFKVVGGPVTMDPSMVFKYLDVDAVMVGEAENKLENFMRKFEEDKLDEIEGVILKDQKDEIPKMIHSNSLDRPLPYIPPDIKNENIRGANVYIETHRGCPGNCGFCQVPKFFGREVRSRKLNEIVNEVKEFVKMGARRIAISGGTGTLYGCKKFKEINEEAFIELLKNLSKITGKENLTIPDIRVDTVSPEIMEAISKYTNGWVFYGIESGSEKILKKMNKGIKIETVYEAVELAREHGVKVAGSFIVGYPGETEDDFEATLSLADDLMLDDYFVSIAEPIPGTPLAEEVKNLPLDKNPVFMEVNDTNVSTIAEFRALKLMLDSYVFRKIPIPMTEKLFNMILKEVKSQSKHIKTVTYMIKDMI